MLTWFNNLTSIYYLIHFKKLIKNVKCVITIFAVLILAISYNALKEDVITNIISKISAYFALIQPTAWIVIRVLKLTLNCNACIVGMEKYRLTHKNHNCVKIVVKSVSI